MKILKLSTNFLNISIDVIDTVWNVVIYQKNGRWLVSSSFSKTGIRRTVSVELLNSGYKIFF
jgi:hypothetical protein